MAQLMDAQSTNVRNVGLSLHGKAGLSLLDANLAPRVQPTALELQSDLLINSRSADVERFLELCQNFPIYLQGKGLSIASTDAIDFDYLAKIAKLKQQTGAILIGDYLGWTGVGGRHIHAMMPAILNQAMIKHLLPRIKAVQDYLGVRLCLENVLAPVGFKANEMSELNFLSELCDKTGCQMSLNIATLNRTCLFQALDVDSLVEQLDLAWLANIKISPVSENIIQQHQITKEAWDHGIWSILSKVLVKSNKTENSLPTVLVRDETIQDVTEVLRYFRCAELIVNEVLHGKQGSARVISANPV